MNSIEALKELTLMINREKHINSEWNKKIYDLELIVKQDLDKLAKLEKENQELREKVNHFKNVKNRTRRNYKFVEKENIKLKKVIERIKSLPNCDICDDNWHKGCMCLQNKLKKALLIDNFENMFINCKLTPLPELEELQDDK